MRLWVVGIVAIGGCAFHHGSAIDPDGSSRDGDDRGWIAGCAYRKPIVITPPGADTLDSFPVAILEASDGDLAAHARADGSDIVFAAEDAITPLASELAGFDHTTGALEAWVKISSLRAPTTIWLYYGGAAAVTDPTAVWPAMYAGVWHLGAKSPGHDSTTHAHDLAEPTLAALPTVVPGIAGAARSYDGIDDSLSIASPGDGSLDFGTGSFSYSTWVYVVSSLGTYDTPIYKGCASQGDPGYCMLLGTGGWGGKLHDGTSFVDADFGSEQLNRWVYLVVVVDRTTQAAIAYLDGTFASQIALTGLGSLTSARSFEVGLAGTAPFHGVIDETRVYAQPLSAAWIAADYANLTSTGFTTIGSEQLRP